MRLELKVVPKASRDRVVGWLGSRLKVQVRAAAERGKANQAVEELLSELLGARVRIVAGQTSPLKVADVEAPKDLVLARLAARPSSGGSRR